MKYPVGSWLMVKVNDMRPQIMAALQTGDVKPLLAALRNAFQVTPEGGEWGLPFLQGMVARVVAAPTEGTRRVSIGGWDHETPVETIDELFEQIPAARAAKIHNAARSAVGLDHDPDLDKL